MLRSLVGSEMCIRDRGSLPTVGQAARTVGRARERVLHAAIGQGKRHAHPCLLYTSDAADDLLCVDLGGRRIIKKKKSIHTTQTTIQKAKLNITYSCSILILDTLYYTSEC